MSPLLSLKGVLNQRCHTLPTNSSVKVELSACSAMLINIKNYFMKYIIPYLHFILKTIALFYPDNAMVWDVMGLGIILFECVLKIPTYIKEKHNKKNMTNRHLIILKELYESIAPLNAAIIEILASDKPDMQRVARLQSIIVEIIEEATQIIDNNKKSERPLPNAHNLF